MLCKQLLAERVSIILAKRLEMREVKIISHSVRPSCGKDKIYSFTMLPKQYLYILALIGMVGLSGYKNEVFEV